MQLNVWENENDNQAKVDLEFGGDLEIHLDTDLIEESAEKFEELGVLFDSPTLQEISTTEVVPQSWVEVTGDSEVIYE